LAAAIGAVPHQGVLGEAVTEDLDTVAAGMILFYGKNAAGMVRQQADKARQSNDQRKFERWCRILQRVCDMRPETYTGVAEASTF